MIRLTCLALPLCLLTPALAGDWTPRASERQAESLRLSLGNAQEADDSTQGMWLREAAQQKSALQDLLADYQRAPSLRATAWGACDTLPAAKREALLVQIARKRVLDTPQDVLEHLGRLALRADPSKTTHAEKTLLALLQRAQEEPSGDWTNRLRLARALAEGGGKRTARALVRLLAQSRPMTGDERQLSADLARLAEHREVAVCQTLVATASRAKTTRQRYLGHTALAAVASPRTRSYLRGAMKSSARQRVDPTAPLDPELRATIEGLARIDTPSAIERALGHASRSAQVTDLVPTLVDWLGEAEDEGASKQLRLAIVQSLRSLTGKRFSAHHASWARYVASQE
jgi:hypothetical protein